MKRPDKSAIEPTICIADASEERRHLLMQYVAIEWPNASITELGDSIQAVAGESSPIADCDMVVVGLSAQEASETGWLDVIRARADAKSAVPVIVVTADMGADIRDNCMKAGADDVLRKPVAMNELFDCMGRVLASKSQNGATLA